MSSRIEWTDRTINPIVGCSKISPGCDNCYAEAFARRLANNPNVKVAEAYRGIVHKSMDGVTGWSGDLKFIPERMLEPINSKKPAKWFVGSMGDMFHSKVQFEWIDEINQMVRECPQHIFQFLTKRPGNARDLFDMVYCDDHDKRLPPNLWMGATIEGPQQEDRLAPLMEIHAAVRFISVEPILGTLKLGRFWRRLDWIICGGENGPKARPADYHAVKALRDGCHACGIPFFFKGWGKHVPQGQAESFLDGKQYHEFPTGKVTPENTEFRQRAAETQVTQRSETP